jgi:RNA polymerase sigma-70 factor (ECF subfamily)
MLRDAHEAEDAFQATFLVLVHKARSIGRPELLGAWLHGVAYRTAARARQDVRRRARAREAAAMPDGDPAVEVIWRDLREVLDEELGRLAWQFRVPLMLVYLDGKTTDEVARLLGCPRGTVLSRLARGRDRLRDRLVRRGIALSVWTMVMVLGQKVVPAAVPAPVAEATIQAAVLTAAGNAASGAIPATVTALTKGVLRSMLMSKIKVLAAVALAVMLAALGAGMGARLTLADQTAAPGKQADPKDEERILGTWVVLSAKHGGHEEDAKDVRIIFAAGDNFTMTAPVKGERGATYKLDPAKKPKEITLTANNGDIVKGIYKFDGDKLTICAGEKGGQRPTEFVTKEGVDATLIVLQREKK